LKDRLGDVGSIVDIGANQGLFMVAARNRFPQADIAAYEPNPHIREVVSWNAESLGIHFFQEAVTKEDGLMDLCFSDSDLHTTARISSTGAVTGTAFRKVIERAGGRIDILKVDCEGGEWDMFDDEGAWSRVRGLTMEYHLWAKEGSTAANIKNILEKLGFTILSLDELSDRYGLVTAVKG
jgi:FkbM family methyltransferase